MATGRSIPFTVEAGAPLRVRVQKDGKSYSVQLQLSVMEVRATGAVNAKDNMPVFEVDATPTMRVTEEKTQ